MLKKIKLQKKQTIAILPYTIIFAAVLAAWFPAFGSNPLFADEYPFIFTLNNGLYSYFTNWIASSLGVWRILGQIINGFNTNHPLFCSVLAVFTHIITVCLFFKATQILLKSTALPLVLALIMGIFPWGYQTIVQVMGYTCILSSTVFWANLILLLRFSEHKKLQLRIFIISYLLTFIIQLIYENLVFSFMVSGFILWINEDYGKIDSIKWRFLLQTIRDKFSGLAPFLAGITYLILYKITVVSNSVGGRTPGFNPGSVLAAYYHQYTNYFVFQPWLNQETRKLIFFSWNLSHVLIFILLISIFIISLFLLVKHYFLDIQKPHLNTPKKINKTLLIYIILLLLGASLIYVFAGGYSLDTRKKYALIPLILLLFGCVWRIFFEHRFKFSRKSLAILMTIGLFGISSTWLVVGVYRYEILRQDALATYIAANKITGDIQIELNPDIEAAWPTMDETLGFKMYDDWIVNVAVKAKRGRLCCKILVDTNWILQDPYAVRINQNPNAVKLRFDPNQLRWETVRS